MAVPRWTVDRIREVRPAHRSGAYAAFAIYFVGEEEPQVTVEYAFGISTGRRLASPEHAGAAVEPYLDEPILPRRLLVDRDGSVSVREPDGRAAHAIGARLSTPGALVSERRPCALMGGSGPTTRASLPGGSALEDLRLRVIP
jgi:hypothetical protein